VGAGVSGVVSLNVFLSKLLGFLSVKRFAPWQVGIWGFKDHRVGFSLGQSTKPCNEKTSVLYDVISNPLLHLKLSF